MSRRILSMAALALLIFALVPTARATDEVIETATWKRFYIPAGTDTTFLFPAFDFDGDGDIDIYRIYQIGIFSSDGPDTLWYHSDRGWWPNRIKPSTDNVIPLRSRAIPNIRSSPISGVPAPADSVVLRYKAMGSDDVYLDVWGF